jgi:hypothetical protein
LTAHPKSKPAATKTKPEATKSKLDATKTKPDATKTKSSAASLLRSKDRFFNPLSKMPNQSSRLHKLCRATGAPPGTNGESMARNSDFRKEMFGAL